MTKIKICGITNLNDALAAAEAGADLLGFNFYAKSPRHITAEDCAPIAARLRQDFPALTLVGVFVNAPVTEILDCLNTCQLHLAQLHGDESPQTLAQLNGRAFKALRLTAAASIADAQPFLSLFSSDSSEITSPASAYLPSEIRFQNPLSLPRPALLIDAAVPGVYGGSGVTANWQTAAHIARQVPLLLAGGLRPENVAEAIAQAAPWGVDVASGVETSPGVKDPAKIRAFITAARKVQ